MTWDIWVVSPHTGSKQYVVETYYNRGHALARLRGLLRAAWRAGSEMEYVISRGLP